MTAHFTGKIYNIRGLASLKGSLLPSLTDKTNQMKKVIAVVVTHNNHVSLIQSIQALRTQTNKPDAILVVNNGSADFTSVWIDNQPDLLQINQNHMGTAGGFGAGIAWAYEQGYTWIWCMNDRGYPKQDALQNLMTHQHEENVFLNSAVIDKTDKKSFVYNTKNFKTIEEVGEQTITGICNPFNGSFIHRNIISLAGIPRQELFICGDGREYYHRMVNKHKIPVKTIVKSIHYYATHEDPHTKEWDYKTNWKLYYFIRNRRHVLLSKYNLKQVANLSYLLFIVSFTFKIMRYQKKDQLIKLNSVLWPMIHSFGNNFTITPAMILTKMNEQASRSTFGFLLGLVRNYLSRIIVPSTNEDSGAAVV